MTKNNPNAETDEDSFVSTLREALQKEKRKQFNESMSSGSGSILQVPRYNPSVDYFQKYNALPSISLTHRSALFVGAMSMHKTSLISDKAVEVLPKIYSDSPEFIRFLRHFSEDLNKEYPVSLDSEGFTETGIYTTFDRLRCVAGYYQSPMSYTVKDNTRYRESLGLRSFFTTSEWNILDELCDTIFSEAKVSAVNVAKLSQGGMRRFSKDPQWKLDYSVMAMNNLDDILDMVDKNKWIDLANKYEMVVATYIQKRGQVDSPGKKRESFDLDYALSGGKEGEVVIADKTVRIGDQVIDDFSAMRARVVHAGPWTVNCLLQSMFTPIMQGMFERFPKTFHVNTSSEIKEVIDGAYILCSDITEYDRSIPKEFIHRLHDNLAKYWDDRLVKLSRKLYTSAYFSRPLDKYGKTLPVWVGNPFSDDDQVFAGNRSGHGGTSVVAKILKVFESICLVNRWTPMEGKVRDFLLGNLGFGTINNGDDEVFWAKNRAIFDIYRAKRLDKIEGFFAAKPEDGQVYSGMMLMYEDKENLIYKPTPRIVSALEKLWVPERSVNTRHRTCWYVGIEQRINDMKSSDIGSSILDLMMSHYRKELEPTYGSITNMILEGYSSAPPEFRGFSKEELMLINNPDIVHYKKLGDNIRDSVLDIAYSKIPPHIVEKFMNRVFKGRLL